MKLVSLITTAGMVATLAGCTVTKNLDQMHDATVKMSDTTDKMKDDTDQMKTSTQNLQTDTEHLQKETDELYNALRQGNALQLRRDGFDAVLKGPTMFKKLSDAGTYFMAYEVELWTNTGEDAGEDQRNILAQQATQEFYMQMEGLAPRDNSVDPTAQPDPKDFDSQKNRTASFNAFAAAAHQVNRKQADVLAANGGYQAISMLSLTEEALSAEKSLNKGTANLGTRELYIHEVLVHKDKAIQLMQTRYNFLPMMFIDGVTQISDKGLFGKLEILEGGWTCDMTKMNIEQVKFFENEVLGQAIEARNFLKSIGVKPVMNSTVIKLLNNMKLVAGSKSEPALAAEQVKLVGMIHDLKTGK